jgi:hypothetical protein
MGIKYLILNRINSMVKWKFKISSHLEFQWNGILTHILHDHVNEIILIIKYNPPQFFDFEKYPMYQNTTEWKEEMSSRFLNYIKILQKHQRIKDEILFIWVIYVNIENKREMILNFQDLIINIKV